MQLNQELFLSGDTLWAGVMVLESEFLAPSQLSKVAYLEIWADGAAIIKRRIVLDQSAEMVAIPLPVDLRSGMYMVRAYTRWMRNGPEAMFFRHWIRVVNPQSPPAVKESDQELFPLSVEMALEGGQIIANHQHTLHIRSTSWDGAPASTNGFLIGGNDTIQTVQLNENGYAKLEFAAQSDTDYQLVVKTTREGYQAIPLGTSTSTGIGMRIVEEDGEAYLQLVGGEEQLRYDATVTIAERGRMRTLPEISFRSDEGRKIQLAELALQYGVAQFILRNEKEEVVGSSFWVEKQNAQQNSNPEEKKPVVTMTTTRQIGENPVGLEEHTRLLAGLNGFIPSNGEQVNLLEEWLPFEANQTVGNIRDSEDPVIKAESNGIILEGTVKDSRGNAVANETVYLAFPGDIAWLHLAVTDSNGLFHFVLEPTIGQPVSTIIRGGKTFNSAWTISLNSGFAEEPTQDSWPSLTIDSETWIELQAYYQVQQLTTKYLDPELESNSQEGISAKTPIYGKPDFTYRFADYTTMPTEEAFIEFIPQAYIRKPNRIRTIYLLNTNREELFPGPPLLMIDGVPVVNSAEIFAVNYRLVDRIELVTQPYVLNGKFINGILNLITYQKDASSVVLREGELRAELLIVPASSTTGNMILTGDHVPDFGRMNEVRKGLSVDSLESMPGSESALPATIWVQSVGW